MASMSDTLEDAFLDHLTGNAAYTAASTVYIGLSTNNAGFSDSGGGEEVVGGGYLRQAISFGAATTTSISNNSPISFPRSTGSQGTVFAWGIFSGQSGGDLLYHGYFTNSRAILIDESFQIATGAISITRSGALTQTTFQNWANLTLRNTAWSMPSALYLGLSRAGASIGPASNAITMDGVSFDEPRWHDHSDLSVQQSGATPDKMNARLRSGIINGSSETYGGYQRSRLVYNPSSNGSASLDYSVTRDEGLWYNDQARDSNWDTTNNRRQNLGATTYRKWTDRVEFPIVSTFGITVGAAGAYTNGYAGVTYFSVHSWADWAVQNGVAVVQLAGYTPAAGKQYGTITQWGIFDAERPYTGNLLVSGSFSSNIVATGNKDVVRIPASHLTLAAA